MLSSDSVLLLLVGLAGGYWLGVLTTWQRAKRIQHFGVSLREWDAADVAKPAVGRVIGIGSRL